jgi:hypothetical protein
MAAAPVEITRDRPTMTLIGMRARRLIVQQSYTLRAPPRRRAEVLGGGEPGRPAVLIEPVAEYFERLRENYRDAPHVRFENVAIAESTASARFTALGLTRPPTAFRPTYHSLAR